MKKLFLLALGLLPAMLGAQTPTTKTSKAPLAVPNGTVGPLRVDSLGNVIVDTVKAGKLDSVSVTHLGANDTIKAKVYTPANDTLTVKGNFSASLSPSTTNRCGLQTFSGTLFTDSLGLCVNTPTYRRTASLVINSGTSVLTRLSISMTGMQSCTIHLSSNTSANSEVVASAQLSSDSGRSWMQTIFWDGNEGVGLARQWGTTHGNVLGVPIDWSVPVTGTTTDCAFITDSNVVGSDTVWLSATNRPDPFVYTLMSGGQYASPGLLGTQVANPLTLGISGRDPTDSARAIFVTSAGAAPNATDNAVVVVQRDSLKIKAGQSLSFLHPIYLDSIIKLVAGRMDSLRRLDTLRHWNTADSLRKVQVTDSIRIISGVSAVVALGSILNPLPAGTLHIGAANVDSVQASFVHSDSCVTAQSGKSAADSVLLPAVASKRHYVNALIVTGTDSLAITGTGPFDTLTSTNLPGPFTILRFGNALAVGVNTVFLSYQSAIPLRSITTNTVTKIRMSTLGTGGYSNIIACYVLGP